MILTVTPNPALDVTYEVERLVPHTSHRVLAVHEVAGGKGVNVASVLASMGERVLVAGAVGSDPGARAFVADLDRRGLRHDLHPCALPTRRTVTVVSAGDGDATAFNEPGPPWSGSLVDELVLHVERLLRVHRPSVLVVSGSVPPGFGDGCAALVAAGRAAGCRVVLDTSRDALLGALPAAPDLVKPNRDELYAVTGLADPVEGARALQDKGARSVLVSLGADGMVLVPVDGPVLRARSGEALRGNPTGAGDACVAAAARGLAVGDDWPDVLAESVAWSAAAVLQPVAGQVSALDVGRLREQVVVEGTEVG